MGQGSAALLLGPGYLLQAVHHSFCHLGCTVDSIIMEGHPRVLKWTPEAKWTFVVLCTALTTAPVLHTEQPGYPFTLFMDASDNGIGTVLSQQPPEG